ncbi:very-short-patch-repair endonuclease [Chiayiivirga flava]|uniref:Very-short-patch-repair endonuclease n=2 Tax=Chiayiivirga flava TaxID=659595 RepID=A0A7W8G002_9GAMM|nr:very-short-patch-repair endonuclease [Chiayiivirga flava]
MTDAEQRLWFHLRRNLTGHHFRRQHPIGPYIADFVCLDARLVIEADGSQHADSATDRRRDAWLQSQGFRILRLWNTDLLAQTDAALAAIIAALNASPPLPTPTPAEHATDS